MRSQRRARDGFCGKERLGQFSPLTPALLLRGEATKERRITVEIVIIRFRTLYSGAFSALTRSRFFKVRSTTNADIVEAVATTSTAKV